MIVIKLFGNLLKIRNNSCIPNVFIFRRSYPAPLKKFYKNVFISESNGGYEINLDKRKLKTPLGKLLVLPNEGLATAIATEWDMQKEHIKTHNMHLTNLCNTAIDNPSKLTKEGLVDSALEFLDTDTLCYRNKEPQALALFQEKKWDPIVDWFEKRFDVKVNILEDLTSLPIPEDTSTCLRRHLMTFNTWSLTGITFAVENLKSAILTLAVTHRFLDVTEAVELSRLEVIFQTSQWGNIEWSHDVELKQMTAKVAAAALLVYLNEETTHFTKKTSNRE